ncbi:hypothetical protein GGI23_003522 [Coemansia sp. RSA 2559]|nr:hypothetical protein GGI23_003522 [Coemansia sp. RSA 2559]
MPKHTFASNSEADAVDSGTVVKHTVFTTRNEEEPSSHIPGYEHIVCGLTHDIREYFAAKERYKHMGISASQIAYTHGFPGVGKTTAINEALKRAHLPVIYGNVHDMIVNDGGSEPSLAYVDTSLNDLICRAAAAAAPVAILLSHVDALVNSEIVQDVAELGNCFAGFLRRLPPNAFVVLESSVDPEKMPGAVRRCDTKQRCHVVPMPRLSQRRDIVSHHLYNLWPGSMSETTDGGLSPKSETVSALVDRIANSAAGYVARDIAILCRQAGLHRLRRIHKRDQAMRQERSESETALEDIFSAMSRLSLDVGDDRGMPNWDDFAHSLKIVHPSQQIEFESERPTKRWSDIGGYANVVAKLKQSMQLATREESARFGVRAPRGVLLHGSSGCGKTAMALAMISESGCSVISIRSSELFSKYLGETEARLRRLFTAARAAAPCIVFIDEVDSLAARRGVQSEHIGGPELRILSTLLNEMDGIHGTSRVVVVGCTNKISQIDDAILRPGKLVFIVCYVGLTAQQGLYAENPKLNG